MKPELIPNPEQEQQERKFAIQKAIHEFQNFFEIPTYDPAQEEQLISKMMRGRPSYVQGHSYESLRGLSGKLSGVRMSYRSSENGFVLFANDYQGDPAPLLVELATLLKERGIKILFVSRQASYDPNNKNESDKMLLAFNQSLSDNI